MTARSNKADILHYYMEHQEVSKSEIAKALNISMPTVMRYTNELLEDHILKETGIAESTGGRKAGLFAVDETIRYAAGIDVTANHISFVLVNLRKKITASRRYRQKYEHQRSYYCRMAEELDAFLKEGGVDPEELLGIGFSFPGIVDQREGILTYSHVLGIRNFSLSSIQMYFPWPLHFDNDAVSAAYAESLYYKKDMAYLSLSNSVGGAFCLEGKVYVGDNYKSAEFGHMLLHPGGRKCYCGKPGCVDAYLNANLLSGQTDGSLETFFRRLEQGDESLLGIWEEYFTSLVYTISNLRMIFDCDIILGGYVGGFLEPYVLELEKNVSRYNLFENDAGYIRICRYRYEAAALGQAAGVVERFIKTLQ